MTYQIQSTLFGSKRSGRFGNQFFQLFFFHILKDLLNCPISLPVWTGQSVFKNHNFPDVTTVEKIFDLEGAYSRALGPEHTVDLIRSLAISRPQIIDITGSFQFHTATLYKHRDVLTDKFIYTTEANEIGSIIDVIKESGQLIAVHWREGDYNDFSNQHPYFWKPSIEQLLVALRDALKITGSGSQIYLASDDSSKLFEILKKEGFKVICAEQISQNGANPFLLDFLALVKSDLLVASNSTLSVAASLLNKNAKIFLRTDSPKGKFKDFSPWHTEVLINQFSK